MWPHWKERHRDSANTPEVLKGEQSLTPVMAAVPGKSFSYSKEVRVTRAQQHQAGHAFPSVSLPRPGNKSTNFRLPPNMIA